MTPRESFKAAFIARCVEEGATTPSAIMEKIEKVAGWLDRILGAGKSILGVGKDAVKTVGSVAVPVALAAPPIAGLIGGHVLGRATDYNDVDVKELQRQELIEEMRRQAEMLSHKRRLREKKNQRGPSRGRMFM